MLSWTGGHPFLTRQLCQVVAESNYFIPSGREAILIEKLVQKEVLDQGKTKVIGAYLKTIQEHLLHNTICLPQMLLQLYLQILQQGEISTNQSPEQQELMRLGLIIEQEEQLRIANRLYQSIFNPDWVQEQLSTLERQSPTQSNQVPPITPSKPPIVTNTPLKNEPLSQIVAVLAGLGLLLISPFVIFFNNSQPQVATENSHSDSIPLSRSALCVKPLPTAKSTQEDWRSRLQQAQKQSPEQLTANCQRNLDQLVVVQALQLGQENRVLEGIAELCQISPTSESFKQAQFWLSRWSNSADWGEATQSYLNSIQDCPSAPTSLSNQSQK